MGLCTELASLVDGDDEFEDVGSGTGSRMVGWVLAFFVCGVSSTLRFGLRATWGGAVDETAGSEGVQVAGSMGFATSWWLVDENMPRPITPVREPVPNMPLTSVVDEPLHEPPEPPDMPLVAAVVDEQVDEPPPPNMPLVDVVDEPLDEPPPPNMPLVEIVDEPLDEPSGEWWSEPPNMPLV